MLFDGVGCGKFAAVVTVAGGAVAAAIVSCVMVAMVAVAAATVVSTETSASGLPHNHFHLYVGCVFSCADKLFALKNSELQIIHL